MKNLIKFIFILVLIVIIGFLFFQYKKQDTNNSLPSLSTSTPTTVSEKKTYTSKTYAFSFSYPASYEVMEYTPEHISVGKKIPGGFDSVTNITFVQSGPSTESTFEEFSLDEARLGCFADSIMESQSCTEIRDLKSFTTGALMDGEEFYIIAEVKNLKTGTITKNTKGPYITFNATELASRMSLLMVSNPVVRTVTESNTKIVESIARSIRFGSSPTR